MLWGFNLTFLQLAVFFFCFVSAGVVLVVALYCVVGRRSEEVSLITHTPPVDSRRFAYTYLGQSLLGAIAPIFCHDSVRSRPSIFVGTTGCGKTELLLSLAYSGARKGRLVIFIDGKADQTTWNKLYYYNSLKAGCPFYANFPLQDLDQLSQSWNPLHSTKLSVDTISSAIFATYSRHRPASERTDGSYYTDYQRTIFSSLCRALHASGLGYNFEDIVLLLENPILLNQLGTELRPEGKEPYSRVLAERNKNLKEFTAIMSGFLNHLKLLQHWSVNSYNPDIELDQLYHSNATVYFGFPVQSQPVAMATLGNILINQLSALSNHYQSVSPSERRVVDVIVDEAGSFIDKGMADWICKARSSGFRLHIGLQGLADLEQVSATFAKQVQVSTPNVFLFNPQSYETAVWFSNLSGSKSKLSRTATIIGADVENEGEETGVVTEKLIECRKVTPDAINQLRVGQCYWRPSERTYVPILMQASMLPSPAQNPEYEWHGKHYSQVAQTKGLFMKMRLDALLQKVPEVQKK